MALRPIFIPTVEGNRFVLVQFVEFEWFPGVSKTQKQKSISSLHAVVQADYALTPLEVSSKSPTTIGVDLSAFNLGYVHPKTKLPTSVESAFQASKVFERGGPFPDLLNASSRDAKAYISGLEFGELVSFQFYGQKWQLRPLTAFYDWLYLNSLTANNQNGVDDFAYDAFTDIEFNPKKSINCQAYSLALYVSLKKRNELGSLLRDQKSFLDRMSSQPEWILDSPFEKYHPHAGDSLF